MRGAGARVSWLPPTRFYSELLVGVQNAGGETMTSLGSSEGPYFARRFGLEVVATLEPLPGVPPTTKHLESVIARAKVEGAKAILTSPYYDPRHAELVERETGARVLRMAQQTGGRPGADDYLAMVGRNVQAILDVLHPGR